MEYLISGKSEKWEAIVGLEIHAQVKSNTKLFSDSPTNYGAEPNSQVSLVDAAMPGMLPVINDHCIYQAVKTGLGLRAKINVFSVFERKNYFYPDLPQGYQISQYAYPIVGEGVVSIDMADGSVREVSIERLHMEQDAGKSMHDQDPNHSLIDLNRAGICLMEIVSKPDMRSPEEAGAFVRKIRSILRYLDTCDGNMEQGSLRADVNVSVRKLGESGLRTRTETKNLNSVRHIMQVIEIESARQVKTWDSGNDVQQETRLFDVSKSETRAMRSKEFAHDYRYFPDPDLLPLKLTQDYVDSVASDLPELPDDKKTRFIDDLNLSSYDAGVLVSELETAKYFELVADGRNGKIVANWVTSNLFGALNKSGLSIENSPISASNLGKLIDLISENLISGRTAKEVFDIMFETGTDPESIVRDQGLEQLSNPDVIEDVVTLVIKKNPEQVLQIKNGNLKAMGWFVGQVMKSTKGSANPQLVNEILKKKLGV